uniref:Uncharacterized protein n=1 Tax=Anguilla anguilla TaxID=7936 RepID=A0A0E9WQQ8_ANGAN
MYSSYPSPNYTQKALILIFNCKFLQEEKHENMNSSKNITKHKTESLC